MYNNGATNMIKMVPIEQVKFNKDLYPRFEADNATINQYRQSIDKLPPILVTEDLTIIDGYHRFLAHKLEGHEKIEVEVFGGDNPKEILLEAIKRNNSFGRQLSTKEKRLNAVKLWKFGFNDVNEIASILSVDVRSARDYTEELRREDKEKRDEEILELYLECYSFEEIAKKLEVSMGTVHNAFKNGKLSKNEQPDDLQFYNVWNVAKLDSEQLKYPGQTPLEIVENIIYYFSDPPQKEPLKLSKVVDPMAGSGIVRHACRKLLRRYMLFDIRPLREDIPIEKNDILDGFPEKAKKTDLVYFDPPYYNLMSEYGISEFNKDYPSFLKSMEISLKNIIEILNPHGKVTLILKPMNEKMLEGEWLDLTFDCISIAKKEGYKLIKRISAPLSTQQFQAENVKCAKEKRAMLNTHRDVVILEVK